MSFGWRVAAALVGASFLFGSVAAAKIKHFTDDQGILRITNVEEGEPAALPAPATLPAPPILKGPRTRQGTPPPSPPPPAAEPAAVPPVPPELVKPEGGEVAPALPQPEAPPEAKPPLEQGDNG